MKKIPTFVPNDNGSIIQTSNNRIKIMFYEGNVFIDCFTHHDEFGILHI